MATNVYIDAFNFYYGATRDTPYKWVDLSKLCALLLPKHSIQTIKLFYAESQPFPDDPGQPQRQQIYLRALRTIPNIEFIKGHFISREKYRRLVTPLPDGTRSLKVYITQEKGSDVNLATHLLVDGFQNKYDFAIVVSDDSDLLEPVRIVSQELRKPVGIINPQKHPSKLSKYATFELHIRRGVLEASQFPHTLTDADGSFSRPSEWD